MFSSIVSAIIDGVLKSALGWIQSIMEKRDLLKQGAQNQTVADQDKELKDVGQANAARQSVDTDVAADPSKLREHDQYERN